MASITKRDTRTYTQQGMISGGTLDWIVAVQAPQDGSEKQNAFAASLAAKTAESAHHHMLTAAQALRQEPKPASRSLSATLGRLSQDALV